jgi:hypothetical protein
MDCKTAHLLLDFTRPTPTELEASEAEALENHLLDCSACARLARDERRLDEHVGQAMREVVVPLGLRERLIAGLQPQALPLPRRRFSRGAWSLAAAAALLLLALGGAYVAARPRSVDLAQLQDNAWAQFNPQREQVDSWLHAGHFRVPAPGGFNYSLLTHYDVAHLDSRSVPMLLFTFPKEGRVQQARVYLLDSRQFNLATLRDAPPVFESGCVVDFIPHPSDPRFGYLVVHNADTVDSFFESPTHLTRS